MVGVLGMRRHLWIRALLGLIPLLGLIGCSSGNEVVPLEVQLIRAGQDVAARPRGKAPERPALRRTDLDPLEGSFMEVTLEREERLAYLFVNDQRQDDSPGRIMIWRSEDNVTMTTRNGMLIATRGLGGDILSSTVQVQGNLPGPATGGEHTQVIRALDNGKVRLTMACDLTDLGPETIEIVERKHATRHLQQRCSGTDGSIINDYWVDYGNGLVMQSRQWAGPQIGYMRFRRLTY